MHTFHFYHYPSEFLHEIRNKIEVYRDDVLTFSISVEHEPSVSDECPGNIVLLRDLISNLKSSRNATASTTNKNPKPVPLYGPDYGVEYFLQVLPQEEIAFYAGKWEGKRDSFCYVVPWDDCDHVTFLNMLEQMAIGLQYISDEFDRQMKEYKESTN